MVQLPEVTQRGSVRLSPEDRDDLIQFDCCLVASWKQFLGGRPMRNHYLKQSSQRLQAEPNMADMRRKLEEVRTERAFELSKRIQHFEDFNRKLMTKLSVWYILGCFKVRDDLSDKGDLSEETRELVNLLTELMQEAQLAMEIVLKLLIPYKDQRLSRILILHSLYELWTILFQEASLWEDQQKEGKALRCTTMFIQRLFTEYDLIKLAQFEETRGPTGIILWQKIIFGTMRILFQFSLSVHHMRLAKDLIERLAPFHEADNFVCIGHNKSAYLSGQSNILFWRGCAAWNSSFDAKQTLDFLSSSLEIQLHSYPGLLRSTSQPLSSIFLIIPRLCAMLGEQTQDYICDKLLAIPVLGDNPHRNKAIGKLIDNIDVFSRITEARHAYTAFSQARVALHNEEYLDARRSSLSCWRGLTYLKDTDFDANWGTDSILLGMFLELADCLRQVYANENEHDIVGWFCSFLLTTAKRMEASFLIAKYRAYYIDHLKRTNQLSEAMARTHLLHLFLVD